MSIGATDRIGVTFSPPTPNGDFHLGHLAGPILGADIYARARRREGHNVGFACSTDDNQTYVVTTANRLHIPPRDLVKTAYAQGSQTLDRGAVSVDLYATTDGDYTEFVASAFDDLRRIGLFEQRTIPLPVDPVTGALMTEAFVTGRCPHCNASARAGSCEICYRYNTPAEIVVDRAEALPTKNVPVWVLDLERFRGELEHWYSTTGVLARPVLQDLLSDGLKRRLPVLPVTYPIDWGIETNWGPGPQRINAWPEITVGHTYWLRQQFGASEPLDLLTQYMGVDNGFYNVFVYPVLQQGLVMAGRTATATSVVTVANHYLQLSGRKFSTSKGHVVWAADYLDTFNRDTARLALALLSPELQESNYTPELAIALATDELAPRLALIQQMNAGMRSSDTAADTSRWGRAANASAARFTQAYDRTNPSVRVAATQILSDLDVLRSLIESPEPDSFSTARGFLDVVGPDWAGVLPSLASASLEQSAVATVH